MRFIALILSLLIVQDVQYPPELPPIPSPESLFRALGFPVVEDEPIDFIQGDVVTVDIMVMLASGALAGNCQAGINRINTTAINSGVATAQTRLVKCLPTTYVSSGSVQTDLTRMVIPGDGFLDNLPAERDASYADTTVLLTKSCDACGVGYLMSGVGSALAVVCESCISNSSFEHEWGHNVGMQHDLPNASGTTGYNYGWCFGNGFKDVLTYPSPCGGTRAPFYSNPDIIYQGKPTGTATANNARVLRERIAVLAGFRVPPSISPTTNHLR